MWGEGVSESVSGFTTRGVVPSNHSAGHTAKAMHRLTKAANASKEGVSDPHGSGNTSRRHLR